MTRNADHRAAAAAAPDAKPQRADIPRPPCGWTGRKYLYARQRYMPIPNVVSDIGYGASRVPGSTRHLAASRIQQHSSHRRSGRRVGRTLWPSSPASDAPRQRARTGFGPARSTLPPAPAARQDGTVCKRGGPHGRAARLVTAGGAYRPSSPAPATSTARAARCGQVIVGGGVLELRGARARRARSVPRQAAGWLHAAACTGPIGARLLCVWLNARARGSAPCARLRSARA